MNTNKWKYISAGLSILGIGSGTLLGYLLWNKKNLLVAEYKVAKYKWVIPGSEKIFATKEKAEQAVNDEFINKLQTEETIEKLNLFKFNSENFFLNENNKFNELNSENRSTLARGLRKEDFSNKERFDWIEKYLLANYINKNKDSVNISYNKNINTQGEDFDENKESKENTILPGYRIKGSNNQIHENYLDAQEEWLFKKELSEDNCKQKKEIGNIEFTLSNKNLFKIPLSFNYEKISNDYNSKINDTHIKNILMHKVPVIRIDGSPVVKDLVANMLKNKEFHSNNFNYKKGIRKRQIASRHSDQHYESQFLQWSIKRENSSLFLEDDNTLGVWGINGIPFYSKDTTNKILKHIQHNIKTKKELINYLWKMYEDTPKNKKGDKSNAIEIIFDNVFHRMCTNIDKAESKSNFNVELKNGSFIHGVSDLPWNQKYFDVQNMRYDYPRQFDLKTKILVLNKVLSATQRQSQKDGFLSRINVSSSEEYAPIELVATYKGIELNGITQKTKVDIRNIKTAGIKFNEEKAWKTSKSTQKNIHVKWEFDHDLLWNSDGNKSIEFEISIDPDNNALHNLSNKQWINIISTSTIENFTVTKEAISQLEWKLEDANEDIETIACTKDKDGNLGVYNNDKVTEVIKFKKLSDLSDNAFQVFDNLNSLYKYYQYNPNVLFKFLMEDGENSNLSISNKFLYDGLDFDSKDKIKDYMKKLIHKV